MLFGMYSDAGLLTCGFRTGSLGFEEVDAQQFAEWGVGAPLEISASCLISCLRRLILSQKLAACRTVNDTLQVHLHTYGVSGVLHASMLS